MRLFNFRHGSTSRIAVAIVGTASLLATAAGTTAGAAAVRAAPANTTRYDTMVNSVGASSPKGVTPEQIREAYGFNKIAPDHNKNPVDGRGQIIAIINFDDDPAAFSDLSRFDLQFSLGSIKSCAVSRTIHTLPCFQTAYAAGVKPPVTDNDDETSLDIEWAHAAAPGADILLVEAASGTSTSMLAAVKAAVRLGATVVSMSWTNTKMNKSDDSYWSSSAAFLGADGDEGCEDIGYPAGSPDVVAVGGTVLNLGHIYNTETAWDESGGGINLSEPRPPYQMGWQDTAGRGDVDVALNAVNFPYYQSIPVAKQGWGNGSGVSFSTPIWAGLMAEIDQVRVARGASVLAGIGALDGLYLAAAWRGSPSNSPPGSIAEGHIYRYHLGQVGQLPRPQAVGRRDGSRDTERPRPREHPRQRHLSFDPRAARVADEPAAGESFE